jgi:hypothetical protein
LRPNAIEAQSPKQGDYLVAFLDVVIAYSAKMHIVWLSFAELAEALLWVDKYRHPCRACFKRC